MLVQVMVIWVLVRVRVVQPCVGVDMGVVFSKHQPGTNRHNGQGNPKKYLGDLFKENQGENGADKWRSAKECAGASRSQTAQSQDEELDAQPVTNCTNQQSSQAGDDCRDRDFQYKSQKQGETSSTDAFYPYDHQGILS